MCVTSGTVISKYLKKNIKYNNKNFTLGSNKYSKKKLN